MVSTNIRLRISDHSSPTRLEAFGPWKRSFIDLRAASGLVGFWYIPLNGDLYTSVRFYLQYRCCITGWQALKLGRFPTVNWKPVSFGTAIGFRLSVKKWHCPPGIGRSKGPDGRRVPLSTLSQQKQPQVITHSCCPASGQTIVSMTKRPWKAKDTSSSTLSLQNNLETIPQNISDS